jgi:hypothetical protein
VPKTQAIVDRNVAEEQFLEQTPWANPQHPAHASANIHNFHTQTAPQQYITPTVQKRHVDISAMNESASTIDVMSNPPSSAAPAESPMILSKAGPSSSKNSERLPSRFSSSADQQGSHIDRDVDTISIPQYHALPSRMTFLSSASPPATHRTLGGEILGPQPQRAIIAASIGTGVGRFGS